MYLVAGMVARNVAGPGVIVSFIIAAIASIFSGKFIFIFERIEMYSMKQFQHCTLFRCVQYG